jgi:nucleoside-diphosphate-sugar epimerase
MIKYLLTGANGFLGSVIKNTIESTDRVVDSLGRSKTNSISIDLSKGIPTLDTSYDIVIHCAGKAHSRPKTEIEKQEFFDVNYQATINLCLALEATNNLPLQFVFISTIAVYGKSKGNMITEDSSLDGVSPYAESKIAAEIFLEKWCEKFSVKLLILRLPLIIGNQAPGNLGKMVKGIKRGTYLSIAGGKARKSMVLVNDVADFILFNPKGSGVFNLTDGYHPTFFELEELISKSFKKNKPLNIPNWFAKFLGLVGDLLPFSPINSDTISKITSNLTFSDEKARKELGWKPKSVIDSWKVIA